MYIKINYLGFLVFGKASKFKSAWQNSNIFINWVWSLKFSVKDTCVGTLKVSGPEPPQNGGFSYAPIED